MHQHRPIFCAGRENRTPTKSLENFYSTIKLAPQFLILLNNKIHTNKNPLM